MVTPIRKDPFFFKEAKKPFMLGFGLHRTDTTKALTVPGTRYQYR
jgi:hypothetical protein